MPSHPLNPSSGSPRLAPVLPAGAMEGQRGAARQGGGRSFRQVLQVNGEGQRAPAVENFSGRRLLGPSARSPTAGVLPPIKSDPSDMKALAIRALDAEKRVEALLASTGTGRILSASELIALQATVFRYSQTVEVISRTTDRLVGALKQTLGTQV